MIPKKLFLTYSSENLPQRYRSNLKRWKEVCVDWEVHFFTDEKIYQLFKQYFAEHYADVVKIPYGAMLADFFRYAVLYIYGGLYTDIDTAPLKRIPEEWLSYDAVIGHEVQAKDCTFFCQWTLLSRPGYSLFSKALNGAIKRLRENQYFGEKILEISGPLFFTEIVKRYQDQSNLLLLDADFFARCPEAGLPFTERSVVQHQFDGELTWKLKRKFSHLRLNLGGL